MFFTSCLLRAHPLATHPPSWKPFWCVCQSWRCNKHRATCYSKEIYVKYKELRAILKNNCEWDIGTWATGTPWLPIGITYHSLNCTVSFPVKKQLVLESALDSGKFLFVLLTSNCQPPPWRKSDFGTSALDFLHS